jgi:3-hydroxymyristoyl/3-hydroxydecanoyl-(acyl carrier protein) dehydratase
MLMDVPLYFRNLDGKGTVHNLLDLRGRTLENKVKLTSMTNFGGTILQHFEYNMTMEGIPIFSGTSSFGYFTHQSLADQVGLDRGQDIRPWYEAHSNPAQRVEIKLNPAASPAYYTPPSGQPHYHLPVNQLNYLDRVLIVPQGGKSQNGYIYGEKLVDTTSWFFKAHFYGDPVMPGSLGVEAMLEALQAYAMQQGLGKKFRNPRFEQALGHTIVWKYRGQIIPRNKLMYLELHITAVKETAGQTVIYADANLWRDNMRIYEVKQLALQILEG